MKKQLKALQRDMLDIQEKVIKNGERVVIIFEGQDTAGKTSTIKSLTKYLNPKHFRVVALGKPSHREKGEWYFQKYISHFPTKGEIVIFDRSYYNRAGVEKVMGFCTTAEYNEFMSQVVTLERLIVKSGIKIIKLWFSINKSEQIKRIEERKTNKLKKWKLSPIDVVSVKNWDKYIMQKNRMIAKTSTKYAVWHIIKPRAKKLYTKIIALTLLVKLLE